MNEALTGGSGTVLIFGATSAIMRALAAELARRGHGLVLFARDPAEAGAIAADLKIRYSVPAEARVLDVSEPGAGLVALEQVLSGGERIAGAVLGIGYLGEQERAQESPDESRAILETNFTAPALLLGRLANHFENERAGFMCVLSSVAGDRGRQSNYIYGSAKGGLSVFLQGLRNRLHRSGVQVTTVKPGFVDTAMTYGLPGLFLVAPPEAVARRIVRAIDRKRNEVYVPRFWRLLMFVIRTIPEPVFKRLRL